MCAYSVHEMRRCALDWAALRVSREAHPHPHMHPTTTREAMSLARARQGSDRIDAKPMATTLANAHKDATANATGTQTCGCPVDAASKIIDFSDFNYPGLSAGGDFFCVKQVFAKGRRGIGWRGWVSICVADIELGLGDWAEDLRL